MLSVVVVGDVCGSCTLNTLSKARSCRLSSLFRLGKNRQVGYGLCLVRRGSVGLAQSAVPRMLVQVGWVKLGLVWFGLWSVGLVAVWLAWCRSVGLAKSAVPRMVVQVGEVKMARFNLVCVWFYEVQFGWLGVVWLFHLSV